MGVSTDGIICLGIPFDEGTNFVWKDEDGSCSEYALEEWWKKRYGDRICPVTMVNYCSYDAPMYVLAVRDTVQECSRGYASKIKLPLEDKPKYYEEYMQFLLEHVSQENWNDICGEKPDSLPVVPDWLLCSFWGSRKL